MVKKIFFIICSFIILFSTVPQNQTFAKTMNVKDCLEDDTDCTEINGSVPNETEDENESSVNETTGNGSLGFDIIKMVFALLLILLLIYILLKFLSRRNKLFHQVKALENIGGISVGQNKSIQIVRIGTRVYMIGVGDNVEMLQEITDEEVKEDLLHREEADHFQASTMLRSFFKRSDADQDVNHSTNQFKTLFTSELQKLKQNRKKIIDNYDQKEDRHE